MTTYRTGNHHGVTIVAEPDPGVFCCNRDDHDCARSTLVAVVMAGRFLTTDRELADRVADRLKWPTPDVPYTCGAREALAEVRRRLDLLPAANVALPAANLSVIRQMLRDAAAELGVDEDAPRGPLSATETAETRAQFRIFVVPFSRGTETLGITHDGCPGRWYAEVDDFTDLKDLVQRAEEHTEVCR